MCTHICIYYSIYVYVYTHIFKQKQLKKEWHCFLCLHMYLVFGLTDDFRILTSVFNVFEYHMSLDL